MELSKKENLKVNEKTFESDNLNLVSEKRVSQGYKKPFKSAGNSNQHYRPKVSSSHQNKKRMYYRCGNKEHLAPDCKLPGDIKFDICGIQGHL